METFFQEAKQTLSSAKLSTKEVERTIKTLQANMNESAKNLEFEKAAQYRDLLKKYRQIQLLEDNAPPP